MFYIASDFYLFPVVPKSDLGVHNSNTVLQKLLLFQQRSREVLRRFITRGRRGSCGNLQSRKTKCASNILDMAEEK